MGGFAITPKASIDVLTSSGNADEATVQMTGTATSGTMTVLGGRKIASGPQTSDVPSSSGALGSTNGLASDYSIAGFPLTVTGLTLNSGGYVAATGSVSVDGISISISSPAFVKINQNVIQPDNWMTFRTRMQVGASLVGQERYAEAEPLLKAGYQGMLDRVPRTPRHQRESLQVATSRLARLYAEMGRPDEAAKWRVEEAKWR
jgi:hypothetical protein